MAFPSTSWCGDARATADPAGAQLAALAMLSSTRIRTLALFFYSQPENIFERLALSPCPEPRSEQRIVW